jgi:dihydropteroate synthase
MHARDAATAAVSALTAAAGAYCVRVHDVKPTLDAVRVAAALPALHSGEGMFDAGADCAVDGVAVLLPVGQRLAVPPFDAVITCTTL